jgi:hypothetical protein
MKNIIIKNNFHTARAIAAGRPPSVRKQPLAKQFCQRPNHQKKIFF